MENSFIRGFKGAFGEVPEMMGFAFGFFACGAVMLVPILLIGFIVLVVIRLV